LRFRAEKCRKEKSLTPKALVLKVLADLVKFNSSLGISQVLYINLWVQNRRLNI
jgi:hypothetical protein